MGWTMKATMSVFALFAVACANEKEPPRIPSTATPSATVPARSPPTSTSVNEPATPLPKVRKARSPRDDSCPVYFSAEARPLPPRKPGEWTGTRVEVAGLELGEFVVVSPPSADHVDGIVAALAYPCDWTKHAAYFVRVDVATGKELSRTPIPYAESIRIAATKNAIVVATKEEPAGLRLQWFDVEGRPAGGDRLLRGAGLPPNDEVRAFEGFDDRLVRVTRGRESWAADKAQWVGPPLTIVRLLDADGRELSSHSCYGGLFAPGDALLTRRGDQIVLTNLLIESIDQPVCAFHLHDAPRWRGTVLRDARLVRHAGDLYSGGYDRRGDPVTRVLTEDLRLGPIAAAEEDEPPPCWGLTGTTSWESASSGEARIVRTVSCCGDGSPDGLFICRPPRDDP